MVYSYMKNQYFADINDYKKYWLLRQLLDTGISMTVCWTLTDDDAGSDGRRLKYLNDPPTWRQKDPELFDFLKQSVEQGTRNVAVIERSGLLPRCRFQSDILQDDLSSRNAYFNRLVDMAAGTDLIFFDPDNGLESKSVKKGKKNSCKYLYLDEVERCFTLGCSLLIFQFFPRENHEAYVARRKEELQQTSPEAVIHAYQTTDVVYFLVAHRSHAKILAKLQDYK